MTGPHAGDVNGMDVVALEAARRQAYFARPFPPVMEQRFRASQRRRYRWPRIGLFLIFMVNFALAPLYQRRLFSIHEDIDGLVLLLELGLVVPACALAALLTRFPAPRWTEFVQVIAVLTIFVSPLGLRYLSLLGGMQYPSQILGVVMIAVAFFGGFRWRQIAIGAAAFGGLGIALELMLDRNGNALLESYALAFMTMIAIVGSYTHELLSRIAWLAKRHASVLARTDPLTHLSSRFEFNQMFPKVLAQGHRERCNVALMLLDIDNFKRINDRHGHLFGDEVLRAIGGALRTNTGKRPLDLRVRYGGEELLVAWYDVSPDSALLLAENLLAAVRAIPLREPKSGTTIPLTASAGLTWLVPDGDTTPEQVLHVADALLYAAKSAGRDRVACAPYHQSEAA